jgi:hypothetical protein
VRDQSQQHAICERFGSPFDPPLPSLKIGIALSSLSALPLNALRHVPSGDTCGWFIWGGEAMSQASDFFAPLHVSHLAEYCPSLVPYLALAPGWRVLLAPGQNEVWFDRSLLANDVGA